MNLMIELKQRRATAVQSAEALVNEVEAQDRDFTPEEEAQYDGLMAEARQLGARIERLDATATASGALQQTIRAIGAPAKLNIPRGDNEVTALAHFVRTGDKGGLVHLMQPDETGRTGVTLQIPTAHQWNNGVRAAVVDSTMNITTAADGANMVPTGFVNKVAMRKNEMMLAEKLQVERVPGKGTTVNYPVEGADPEDFATTAEQADNHSVAYERDAGVTNLKAFTLVKKTRKVDLTEELLEDNDVDLMNYIGNRIGRQIAQTHNGMLLTEVATNGTALKTYAAAAAIAAGEPKDIVFNNALSYYMEDESGSIAWVMRPATFGDIASLTGNPRLYAQTPGGSFQRELLGYPVHYSQKAAATAASAKDVYFGVWNQVGYREAPELRFISDPYSVDGLVILKYSFRAVYGVLQAAAVGYAVHPSA
jgi:HK97 family phage major capsid protein